MELLLSNGANVNDKTTDDGFSSLFIAFQEGHVEVVMLLLSNGAIVNDLSNYGDTAISVSNSDKITYILRKWPITMVILIFKELCVYLTVTDAITLMDLYQFMGKEDCTVDNEEDYNFDDDYDDDEDDEDANSDDDDDDDNGGGAAVAAP